MEKKEEFSIVNGELVLYTGHSEEVVIPEGVTSIGPRAFNYSRREPNS